MEEHEALSALWRRDDCALGNGCMILLHPEDQDGFSLSPGDSVTLSLTSNDACILQFNCFRDGVCIFEDTATARQHSFTFPIDQPGLYCFSILNSSASASTFTDCTLTIQQTPPQKEPALKGKRRLLFPSIPPPSTSHYGNIPIFVCEIRNLQR